VNALSLWSKDNTLRTATGQRGVVIALSLESIDNSITFVVTFVTVVIALGLENKDNFDSALMVSDKLRIPLV
jgi:hypothetical protein